MTDTTAVDLTPLDINALTEQLMARFEKTCSERNVLWATEHSITTEYGALSALSDTLITAATLARLVTHIRSENHVTDRDILGRHMVAMLGDTTGHDNDVAALQLVPADRGACMCDADGQWVDDSTLICTDCGAIR